MKFQSNALPTESPSFGGPYVIAEIGVNHGGDLDLAFRLIDEAAAGGADCVKFQTYKAGRLASTNSPSYWDLESEPTTSQFELFSKYDSFGVDDYCQLADRAMANGVSFASTPFDLDAVEDLAEMMPFFKIASADITNFELIEAVAQKGKPIILSTGASLLDEIRAASEFIGRFVDADQLALLHCVLEYPTPYEDANLRRIETLKAAFPEHVIGYSDHTRPDSSMSVLMQAWVRGAVIIEKHFTHDKTLPGNDHYHAMDSEDLRRFRECVGLWERVAGSEEIGVLAGEEVSRKNARRSLVAVRNLKAGHIFNREDLAVKRPAFGLAPSELSRVLGRTLAVDLKEDEFLTDEHLG